MCVCVCVVCVQTNSNLLQSLEQLETRIEFGVGFGELYTNKPNQRITRQSADEGGGRRVRVRGC